MSPPGLSGLSGRAARAPLRRLDSRMSRRGLLGAGVLAGVLAVSGVPVAARPRGGTLRLAVAAPSDGLLGAVETLTEIGASGELLPGLAAGWETDGTARHWRLLLDREARTHAGAPLAPADVEASLRRARLAGLEAVEADGSHGLVLRLAASDPDLPFRLAASGLGVRAEGPLGGTGLYRPAADGLSAQRVEGHRRDGQAGFVDAVELVVRPDPEARLAALLAGDADAAEGVSDGQGPGLLVAEAPGGEPWATLRALLGEVEAPAATLHSARVAHGAVSGAGPLDGGRIAERWWLSA